jgi:hypothetical protein
MLPAYHHFNERFPGLEFDWFASDAEGNIGLFSTAGFGPVPDEVQLHFQGHDQVAALLDWRVPQVWKECASRGLFVFDWQHWQGPYRKEESPLGALAPAFKRHILSIPKLPFFKGSFQQIRGIAVQESGTLEMA